MSTPLIPRSDKMAAIEYNVITVRKIEIVEDKEELNRRAAESFKDIADEAIARKGSFTTALAGGSTPRSVYELLASEPFKARVDWTRVYFFFGDERFVQPDSEESNYRMAREAILEPLGVPPENIFRWETECDDPAETASRYEKTIRRFFDLHKSGENDHIPRFDLILLGMGPDGHTASLFPFSPALRENEKLAAANWVEKLDAFRVTLTFPVLNHAANVIFLVAGDEKAETLAAVLEGEFNPDRLPSQEVEPLDGRLVWLVDRAAARLLTEESI
jgi:6-phosphogluconolactonase